MACDSCGVMEFLRPVQIPNGEMRMLCSKCELPKDHLEEAIKTGSLIQRNGLWMISTAAEDENIKWITVRGNPVPIHEGESKEEAVGKFLADKSKGPKKSKAKPKPKPTKQAVDYTTARENWLRDSPKIKEPAFSYDPATGKHYDALNKNHAKQFYKTYGKGQESFYVVANTNNKSGDLGRGIETSYSDARGKYDNVFFGKWTDNKGKVFTDISFTVYDEKQAKQLAKRHSQQSIMKVFNDGTVEFT